MNIGDKAPVVLGINEKGVEIRLSDYKGKKIVLDFYPKDMTSGGTAQACNLRDNYADLRKAGYEVIGVSVDLSLIHIYRWRRYRMSPQSEEYRDVPEQYLSG